MDRYLYHKFGHIVIFPSRNNFLHQKLLAVLINELWYSQAYIFDYRTLIADFDLFDNDLFWATNISLAKNYHIPKFIVQNWVRPNKRPHLIYLRIVFNTGQIYVR